MEIFDRVSEFWNKHGWNILVFGSIVIILLLGIYHKLSGKKGSWSKKISYAGMPPKGPMYAQKPQQQGNDSKGEVECRRVLEAIFRKPFDKARPDFLKNPVTGSYNLELDCFNPELRLAVEYNGVQHYKYTPYFHRSKDAFHNQKYRDLLKRQMCQKNNINLVEVPYTVQKDLIQGYLLKELSALGYNV